MCCNYHTIDEKERAIDALQNPPNVLQKVEDMQEYLTVIDEEGLLAMDYEEEKSDNMYAKDGTAGMQKALSS